MAELRNMTVFADGVHISGDYRMHLRGRSTMSLRPDLWELSIHNLGSRALAAISDAEKLSVEGDDLSLVCEGKIMEIYPHVDDGKRITTIMISDGADFWSASISLALAKNNTAQGTIRAIANRCSSPVPVGSIQAKDVTFFRGQTLHGRAADYIATLAKSIGARAYFVRGTLYVVSKGTGSEVIQMYQEDLLSGVTEANGAYIVRPKDLKGYPVGQLVCFPDYSVAKYRLLCQSVDADNYEGQWRTELIMVDESRIQTGNDWGGG